MVCSFILLLVVIAIINVVCVWVFKMKLNSQYQLIGKLFLSFFTRQGKTNLRCNSQQLKFKALWLIFSKFLSASDKRFMKDLLHFHRRHLLVFSVSPHVLQLFPGLLVSLFSFMSWFKLPGFSQPESGCEQFVCLAQVCHCKLWVTSQIFLFQRWQHP